MHPSMWICMACNSPAINAMSKDMQLDPIRHAQTCYTSCFCSQSEGMPLHTQGAAYGSDLHEADSLQAIELHVHMQSHPVPMEHVT